ncbi:uncharacterized, partial [Tachysurus ichikawai]
MPVLQETGPLPLGMPRSSFASCGVPRSPTPPSTPIEQLLQYLLESHSTVPPITQEWAKSLQTVMQELMDLRKVSMGPSLRSCPASFVFGSSRTT